MKFVDRKDELSRLESLYDAGQGGLAVIWGRRRVGKTRLLLEWCKDKKGLYMVADRSAASVQRHYLAGSVSRLFPGFDQVVYPTWRSWLNALSKNAMVSGWRGPVVFDELPYLVEQADDLPSALQAWLDHEAKQAGLAVAVAGSAQHMMQGLVLDRSSPLFGRAVEIMRISQMAPAYLGSALGIGDPVKVLESFFVWGGIPHYWELARPFGKDLDKAVEALIMDPLGPLHMEPDRILGSEIPSASRLRPILDMVGSGVHRVSELGGRLEQPASSLSRPLARLVELGLIKREKPFGTLERGSKRTLYRMNDNFMRVWFKLVAPRRSELECSPVRHRRAVWKAEKKAIFGEAFEDVCRAGVPGLDPRCFKGIGPFGPAGRWWGPRGPEWDVVAVSENKEHVLLGEVKWHEKPADERFLSRIFAGLKAKGMPADKNLAGLKPHYVVFVPSVKPGSKPSDPNLTVIGASQIVKALG